MTWRAGEARYDATPAGQPEPESGSELELPPESESVILGSLAHSGRACDGLPVRPGQPSARLNLGTIIQIWGNSIREILCESEYSG